MSLVQKGGDILAMASGTATTVTASDTVQTNLREVKFVLASMVSDPVAAAASASAVIADQIATPGAFTLKTWTSAQAAATTFSKSVSWVAFGK